ncbi:MAG: SDR family oxidoreductase [Myxococcales bacterium]|nr:SDR family oxidoreductase [Myxococcales bacterium]MCB9578684.1 SDR family oxidoreductase [Polyangiaceae bacterium]
MADIRFDNRVAIVTGAGGGLGRAHALLLASRGAKVVVNDLGGAVDGSGSDKKSADKVVDEIKAAGGEAVANYDGVDTPEGAAKLVATAKDAFGKLDIVINNAGILRDVSFMKMTQEDWDKVLAVHLTGTMNVSKAAWPLLRENSYGRVVNTTSAAGLYGNFGQANYSAAKLGIVGLSKTLAHEGAKYDIKCNVIAPIAKSRMTETIMPPNVLEKLLPEYVSPLVAYLCSEGLAETAQVYAVGGGYFSRVAVVEGEGVGIAVEKVSPETVAEQWAAINDLSKAKPYGNAMEAAGAAMKFAMS